MKGVTICSLGYAEMGSRGRVSTATGIIAGSFPVTEGRGLLPSTLPGGLFLSDATNA
jgi:hypothetical protein